MDDILLEVRGARKSFGEVKALDDVSMRVRKGSIHGLLGENGAGKSTLMNILYGLYSPDSGEIDFEGARTTIASPADGIALGIGMVHQVSTLVGEFTAVENIALGVGGHRWTLPLAEEAGRIEELAKETGFDIPLDRKVKELSAGVKQKVEILRALRRGAKLLILDEPTTSLVESEFRSLLVSLRALVARGVTIIFITHKIKEVLEACDDVTVLRRGRVQGQLEKNELSMETLVKLMFIEKDIAVTENALPVVKLSAARQSEGKVLELVDVTTKPSSGKRGRGLTEVSLSLRGGEILGVAAVSGNGEKDLAELLFKTDRVLSGDVLVTGKSVLGLSPTDVFAMGVSYTPEDRIQEGILPEASIVENVLLGHHAEKRFSFARTFVNWSAVRAAAKHTIAEYSVATPDENLAVRRLSGGNIQKVIMGRAFVSDIALLVTHNPTSGVDISTVEFIYGKLAKMREEGGAVLWIHEDVDELMMLCDRIITLHDGRVSGAFDRADFDKYKIGLAMIGGAA
jgi:simple sugar transport system ATP-binding protein